VVEFYRETEFKETEIGRIPTEWRVVKLGDVAKNVMGGTPSTKIAEYWENGDIVWVTATDINDEDVYIFDSQKKITKLGLENSNAKLVPRGAVLMVTTASVGKLAIAGKELAINQQITALIPFADKILSEFLYYALRYHRRRYIRSGGRTTAIHINQRMVRNFCVPLPPLEEQELIAGILSSMDEAIRAVDASIAEYERLKRGLMQELLTKGIGHKEFKEEAEIGRIPASWEAVRLGKVASIVHGFAFPLKFQGKKNGKYPFIKVSDMNLPGNEKYVTKAENTVDDEDLSQLRARVYPPGTIIFPKIGMVIRLNKKRILGVHATFDNNVMGVIPKGENVDSEFLYYYFLGKIDLWHFAQTTTTPSIKKSTIERIYIPLPPLEEQKRIAEILSSVDAVLEEKRRKKAKLERMKKAVMDLLLTGKVRVRA